MTQSLRMPASPKVAPDLIESAERLAKLATECPGVYGDLMAELRKDQQHRRWIAWSDVIVQTIGHLCGLTTVLALGTIAWHAIDSGNATQGAAIITAGTGAIVAVFVTGRLTRSKR